MMGYVPGGVASGQRRVAKRLFDFGLGGKRRRVEGFHLTFTLLRFFHDGLFMQRMKASVDSLFLLLGECTAVSLSKGTPSQALGQPADPGRIGSSTCF